MPRVTKAQREEALSEMPAQLSARIDSLARDLAEWTGASAEDRKAKKDKATDDLLDLAASAHVERKK